MFGNKRKRKVNTNKINDAIKDCLSPSIQKASEKIKFHRKIRIANIWARKHPKKLMAYYVTFALCLLSVTLIFDFLSKKKTNDGLDLKLMPTINHRLNNIYNTEIQNEKIRMALGELGAKGMELYQELDSLIRIPNKTHEDSVKIYSTYNILNNTFNKQQAHEPKKD